MNRACFLNIDSPRGTVHASWCALGLSIAMVGFLGCGWPSGSPDSASGAVPPDKASSRSSARNQKSADQLRRALAALGPKDVYIVVDTAENELLLRRGDATLRRAVISSGSGTVLEDPATGRQWVFETPRGVFTIQGKLTNPAWVKPDWAFIEEGKEPPKDRRDRVELGVLGEYALAFGDGYFIHGTLYTRLLGRNVTHGCIRVGDDDLKAVYKAARIGTPLFIL